MYAPSTQFNLLSQQNSTLPVERDNLNCILQNITTTRAQPPLITAEPQSIVKYFVGNCYILLCLFIYSAEVLTVYEYPCPTFVVVLVDNTMSISGEDIIKWIKSNPWVSLQACIDQNSAAECD